MFIPTKSYKAAKAVPYKEYINVPTRAGGPDSRRTINKKVKNPFYDPNAKPPENPLLVRLRSEQAAFQKQLAAQAEATQADIAKQLQIVQQEKSAVAKMQEDYAAALKAEADAKRKAQEDAQIALTTAQANQARAGRQANLQIQPAGQTPSTAGTQRFKLRGQFSKARQALTSGLNIGQSNSLNLG